MKPNKLSDEIIQEISFKGEINNMTNKKDSINPTHCKAGNGELIDVIQTTVKDFGSVCQANMIKYAFRADKKHKDPRTDIEKIIRYGEFWLNDLEGKKASEPRLVKEETNHQEDFSPFDKLKEMLSPQEKIFLQDKKIVMVRMGNDNFMVNERQAQELIHMLGGAIYGED